MTDKHPPAQSPAISQSELDELYSELIYAYADLDNIAHAMHSILYSKCSFRRLSMEYQTLIGRLNRIIHDKLEPNIKNLSKHSDNNPLAGIPDYDKLSHASDDGDDLPADDDYPF